ncbi:MAG: D-aminoacyl-tRNA deacylase [Candidatus Omnitrophota bacterium]|nr:D-aminoacyl-tRNA deacylase [Candidatus Omnitrophota bacterium]
MRIVLQRVNEASVVVEGTEISAIERGFLLLVGVGKGDTRETAAAMAAKISKLRVFQDENGKMNLDLKQVRGEVLSVPQFTLLGNTGKGNRPGFDAAAAPQEAKILWKKFNEDIRSTGIPVKEGEFSACMEVKLVNDGPVTFVMDSEQVRA